MATVSQAVNDLLGRTSLQLTYMGVAVRLVAAAVFKTVGTGLCFVRWVRFPSTPAKYMAWFRFLIVLSHWGGLLAHLAEVALSVLWKRHVLTDLTLFSRAYVQGNPLGMRAAGKKDKAKMREILLPMYSRYTNIKCDEIVSMLQRAKLRRHVADLKRSVSLASQAAYMRMLGRI